MDHLTVETQHGRAVRWHSLTLDVAAAHLRIGECVIAVTRAEIGLLELLISRRNLPMSKEAIMAELFGRDHGRDLRQVDVFVARLRRALVGFGLSGLIQTIDGRGYAVLDDADELVPGSALPCRQEIAAPVH